MKVVAQILSVCYRGKYLDHALTKGVYHLLNEIVHRAGMGKTSHSPV